MKRAIIFYLTVVLFALASTSCEKDETLDGIKMRLTKISSDAAMENPFLVLEYNSQGLLSKFTEMGRETMIEYNEDNLPVKLTKYDEDHTDIKTIEWTENGFKRGMREYILNSDNQISAIIELEQNPESHSFDTVKVINYVWNDKESLKRICTYYPPLSQWNDQWEDHFTFGTGYSPFKGINIALIATGIIEWAEWAEPQNESCTTEFSDSYLGADIVYDLNENNYPVKAAIQYSDVATPEYTYFDYE